MATTFFGFFLTLIHVFDNFIILRPPFIFGRPCTKRIFFSRSISLFSSVAHSVVRVVAVVAVVAVVHVVVVVVLVVIFFVVVVHSVAIVVVVLSS